MKVNHDPQISLYNVWLAAKCSKDEQFEESLELTERRNEFLKDPSYIMGSPKQVCYKSSVLLIFDMIEASAHYASANNYEKEKIERAPFINPTHRTKAHFYEALKMLDGVKSSIKHQA